MADDFNIAGGWLGAYQYSGFGSVAQVRFEATFRTIGLRDPQIDGEIVDDGALGVAVVSGSQTGAIVRFSKLYTGAGRASQSARIEYAGVVSDDGMVVRGTWQLHGWNRGVALPGAHGSWYARRRWSEVAEGCEADGEVHLAPIIACR